jgi:ribosomal protein S18 acetylase RimI-like enzyme
MIMIRPAQPGDALAMGHVMVESYLRAHNGQIPEQVWQRRQAEWTPEVSASAWEETIRELSEETEAHECIYVAVDASAPGENTIVGLVMGGPSSVGGWQHAGDIYALYISFDYHRRGVGRRLLQAAFTHLRQLGLQTIIIRSLPANDAANRFYEALGGQMVGECEKEEYGHQIVERIYCWRDGALLND